MEVTGIGRDQEAISKQYSNCFRGSESWAKATSSPLYSRSLWIAPVGISLRWTRPVIGGTPNHAGYFALIGNGGVVSPSGFP
jgi:hypothetical protein